MLLFSACSGGLRSQGKQKSEKQEGGSEEKKKKKKGTVQCRKRTKRKTTAYAREKKTTFKQVGQQSDKVFLIEIGNRELKWGVRPCRHTV